MSSSSEEAELVKINIGEKKLRVFSTRSLRIPRNMHIPRNVYERLLALRMIRYHNVVVFECPSNLLLPLGLVPVHWITWKKSRESGLPKRIIIIDGVEYVCADDYVERLTISPHLSFPHALALSAVLSRYLVFSVKDFAPLDSSTKNEVSRKIYNTIREALVELKRRVDELAGSKNVPENSG